MKRIKKSYILLASVLLFMLAFYKQSIGINLFVFNVLLLKMVFLFEPKTRKNPNMWLLLIGALITSGATAWYADVSSVFLNILTLVVMPIFLHQKHGTMFLSVTLGIWNTVSAPVRIFTDRRGEKADTSTNLLMKRILFYAVLPFVVLVLFIFLYRFINPVWGDYIWKLLGNIFSWSFVGLLVLAVVLLYAFWYFIKSSKFAAFAVSRRNELAPTLSSTFKSVPLGMEMGSGVLLFTLLNLLLFSLLATDFQQLIIDDKIPEGYTLSEYLHRGVYAVILSIVFAVGLIVFYFKGAFNYYKNRKVLRILVWVWIVLNAILVLFAIYKNILYVEAYDLTFKRVSVFIYLLLCWVGLYFTSVKIAKKKTFIYIVRKMYWAFYIMWVLTTPINWTNWMTTYNLNHAKEKNYKKNSTDIAYLTKAYGLNELNIEALTKFLQENPDNPYGEELRDAIDQKFLTVLQSDESRKWRGKRLYDLYIKKRMAEDNYQFYSANINNGKFYPELENVKKLEYVLSLNRGEEENNNTQMKSLKQYKNVENLVLKGRMEADSLFSLKDLESMKKLRELTVDYHIQGNTSFRISGLPDLEVLRIYTDYIHFLEFQDTYPNLKTLDLGRGYWKEVKGLHKISDLENLYVVGDSMDTLDIKPLKKLKRLSFEGVNCFSLDDEQLAYMEELSIVGLNITFEKFPKMANLQTLSCTNSKLKTLKGIENFPNLKYLTLSQNQLKDISMLQTLSQLKGLNIESNIVSNISVLERLPYLEELSLRSNPIIVDTAIFYKLPDLKFLYVDRVLEEMLEEERLPKGIVINGKMIIHD